MQGKTAAQEAPDTVPSVDGWADRQTLNGKASVTLSFAVILIEPLGKIDYLAFSLHRALDLGRVPGGLNGKPADGRVFGLFTTDNGWTLFYFENY